MIRPTRTTAAVAICVLIAHSHPNPSALAQDGPAMRLLPKQVCAPPSDILDGTVRLPAPIQSAITSFAARIPVSLRRNADGAMEWTGEIPVDSGVGVRMMVVQRAAMDLAWHVTAPVGSPIGVEAGAEVAQGVVDALADAPMAEMRRFAPGAPGIWTVRIAGDVDPGHGIADGIEHAWVVIASDSPHGVRSWVDTIGHVPGTSATILADVRTDARSQERAILTEVVVHVDGRAFAMLDDGMHGDGEPGDGVFGARIPVDRVGAIGARVEAMGVTEDGRRFLRTVDHRIAVAPGGVEVAPHGEAARMVADGAGGPMQVRIDVPVEFADPSRRVVIGTEVWGARPDTGAMVPAVWAAMVAEPREIEDGSMVVSVYVDRRWLATESVGAPFELRHTRIHDLDNFVPVAHREAIALVPEAGLDLPHAMPRAIDRAMVVGRPRADLALTPTIDPGAMRDAMSVGRAFGAHNLMLSHGYCAGGSPWPIANFSGFLEVFGDPNQNRTHDQFAQLVLAFGNNSKSFGIIGHSQGGCAALHLWNFYFSGLDWAGGGRLIQSVGTPYQGTPLASLGDFSCGVNNDLTPAGAATWLSTIPTGSRAAVHYWTTSFATFWCDFFASLLIASPNDGVVEVTRGQLPGANNMGNTTGWCHTTGMANPAQYTDAARNSNMNANAAR